MTRALQGPGRLVRAGFADRERAERLLAGLGLWTDGAPTDDGAEAVLLALIDVTDPDLALAALDRLAAAHPDRAGLLAQVQERAGLRRRLLAVLGASDALGDHLVAHPEHVELLVSDETTSQRPSIYGLQTTLLRAVGADPLTPPPWGTGGARAAGTGPAVIAALRTAYRGCLL